MAETNTIKCHHATCNDPTNARKKGRSCHTCKLPYHLACVGLKQKQSKELLIWNCRRCLDGNNNDGPAPAPYLPDDELATLLPQLVGNWKKNIRVLARVPKGARVAVADALATLIEDVNTSNNIMS